MKSLVFVTAWVALLLATAGSASPENEARVYAVLSLVGDKINVVTYQGATGSSLDRNVHESIPVTSGVFDKAALLAADDALKRHDTAVRVSMLASSTPDLFANQDRFFDGSRIVLPKEIESAARAEGATHLVLITKYRGDAHLQAQNQALGSGKLEGIGFYVDPVKVLIRSDTGERGRGFLAPFVYIKVSLVDLNTSTVIREQVVTSTTTLSAARTEGSNPWDALSPAQKVDILRRMIDKELFRVIPQITAQP